MILQLTIKCCHQTPTAAAASPLISLWSLISTCNGEGDSEKWRKFQTSNQKTCFSVGTWVLVFFSVSIKFIQPWNKGSGRRSWSWSEHSGVAQGVPHTCCSSYLRTCPEALPPPPAAASDHDWKRSRCYRWERENSGWLRGSFSQRFRWNWVVLWFIETLCLIWTVWLIRYD